MQIEETGIDGLLIIKPSVFGDSRGAFFESYNQKKFEELGLNIHFVQDNQSVSQKNVLRGLHFQNPPFAQGKLVRVTNGAVLDVAVDIRKNSATYGEHFKIELSATNNLMLWIPEGFAHGFLTLTDNTVFVYKCTGFYNKSSESAIIWNDSDLNIDWGTKNPLLSEKDLLAQPFKNFNSEF
ncbi:MAG: dTDP-4-dehydrorhamnose 3,5-epimerase [Bacteroidota bacterium]